MEYAGASAATGITTPVSTWQIDFTARLHGMDEATRKAALDIYGPGLFFNDAFNSPFRLPGRRPSRRVLPICADYVWNWMYQAR
ncbi:gp19 [Salmonella enterica subsp. arizonae]|uniref:Gp19 n=1 Tax=Salmonella enterica subsp. arizonae TaxID=59203 RepID=A0A3S4FXU3_SALER|nr:gp19 [Salmonella enterica subsp. arizonae]